MKKFTLFCFLLSSFSVNAKDLYWVGEGEWNNAENWALTEEGDGGAGIPNENDNVFITGNSPIISITKDAFCNDLSWTVTGESSSLNMAFNTHLFISGSIFKTSADHLFISGKLFLNSKKKDNFLDIAGILDADEIEFSGKGSWKITGNFIGGEKTKLTITEGIVQIENAVFSISDIVQNGGFLDLQNSKVVLDQEKAFDPKKTQLEKTTILRKPNHSGQQKTATCGTIPFTITAQVVSNYNGSQISCNSGCDAEVSVSITGGSGSFSYTWVGGPSNQNWDSLCAGTYTVIVTDLIQNQDCIDNVSIIEPPIVSLISMDITTSSCSGLCDAQGSIIPIGGTGTLSTTWSTGETGNNAFLLCEGSNFIQITDDNNCLLDSIFTVIPPPALNFNEVVNNPSCDGNCDGLINVNPSGGTGPYSFVWTPSGQITPTISGLCAGNYLVSVTDSLNCTRDTTFVLVDPPSPSITLEQQENASCSNMCDGIISLNITNVNAPFFVQWYDADANLLVPGATGSTITNLCAGNYNAIITDVNGCQYPSSVFNIVEPTEITAIFNINSSGCGVCDGDITIIPSGGLPDYNINWGASTGNQTGLNATNLCSGVHNVLVTDTNGCQASFSTVIADIPAEVISTSSVHATCFNSCDGTATVSFVCGDTPCSVEWFDVTTGNSINQFTNTATNLCPGDYFVSVTNGSNCTAFDLVTISSPSDLIITDIITAASCGYSCDGTITLNPNNPVGSLSYAWFDAIGNPISGANSNVLSNVCPGDYTVVITDGSNCSFTRNYLIPAPLALSASFNVTSASCLQSNGATTVTASGGIAGYTFLWLDNQFNSLGITGNTLANQSAGTYHVQITDAQSCVDTFMVIIDDDFEINLSLPTVVQPICNDSCIGSILYSPNFNASPITYQWYNAETGLLVPNKTDTVIAGLCSGSYFLEATNDLGCIEFSDTTTIVNPTPIAITYSDNPTTCNACDGNVVIDISGGAPGYSILWDAQAGNQTTDSISNLCSGIYQVSITDTNLCEQSFLIPLDDISSEVFTLSTVDANCIDACDGSASVSLTCSNPPCIVNWVDVSNGQTIEQNTNNIFGLCAGSYIIQVTNDIGCTVTDTFSISEPEPFIFASNTTPPSCFGQCDGAISIVELGSGYSYAWYQNFVLIGGQSATTISNLCSGTYGLTITDSSDCEQDFSFFIPNYPKIIINAFITDASCGNSDGSATVVVNGGIPSYQINWFDNQFNPLGITGNTANNLSSGLYYVSVTDVVGCEEFQPITISDVLTNSGILGVTTDDATCSGASNGSINLIIDPAFNYSFLWLPGGQTTANNTNVTAGDYTVIATDNNTGCVEIYTYTIEENSPMSASFNSTLSSQCGSCDATSTVSVSGGTGPYSFIWAGGSTSNFAIDLCPGMQPVTVTDSLGCMQTFLTTIKGVSDNPLGFTSITHYEQLCANACTGSITIIPTGGTAPYTIFWPDLNQYGDSVSGLCTGDYVIQIQDSTGCVYTEITSLQNPDPIIDNAVVNPTDCNQCDGRISVNPVSNGNTYTFLWSTGSTENFINNLCAGFYNVTITSQLGCSEVFNYQVNELSGPVIGLDTLIAPNCNGNCDGEISVNLFNNGPNPTISWHNNNGTPLGVNDSTITNLCSGTYIVQVVDSGCTSFSSLQLPEPAPIVSGLPNTISPTCFGGCDGQTSVSFNGGVLPYQYSWDDSSNQTTNPAINLCNGNYNLLITDANNCTDTVFNVAIQSPLAVNLNKDSIVDADCQNVNNGYALVSGYGGVGGYLYQWSGPNGFNAFGNSQSNLLPGIYTIDVSDSLGCGSIHTVLIDTATIVIAVANPDSSFCDDGVNSFMLNASGGTNYTWFDELGNNLASTNSFSTTNAIGQNIYYVEVADMGCSDKDSVVISVLPTPVPNPGVDTSICEGDLPYLLVGSGGMHYAWFDENNDLIDSLASVSVIPNLGPSTYYLSVESNGCAALDSLILNVITNPNADAGGNTSIASLGQSVTLGGNPSGPSGSSFIWSPSFGLDNDTLPNPSASPTVTSTYILTVTDAFGCMSHDSVTVEVLLNILFPNGFSPNGDGVNDTWEIDYLNNFDEVIVEVYNRWGQLLFKSEGYKTPWNGKYQGSDLPVGTYYYVIVLRNNDELIESHTGPLTIIR